MTPAAQFARKRAAADFFAGEPVTLEPLFAGPTGKRVAVVGAGVAGLTVARTIFREPYLSVAPRHQGLLLHAIYHRPNGWDYIPPGRKIPCGESCLWGDYHARELALLVQSLAAAQSPYTFFSF